MARAREKKSGSWFWRVLLALSCCGLAVTLAFLVPILADYVSGAQRYERVRELARPAATAAATAGTRVSPQASSPAEPAPQPTPQPAPYPIDFQALSARNAGVVGWLMIGDTVIDYPVVWRDNEFYLTHAFDGETSRGGCLFLDGNLAPDWQRGNNLIYGHNMKDGSMFGLLKRFREPAYAQTHDHLLLYTAARETYRLFSFSAYGAGETGAYLRQLSADPQEALAEMLALKKRSDVDFDTQIAPSDRMVTLVTCSSSKGEARFVLHTLMKPL